MPSAASETLKVCVVGEADIALMIAVDNDNVAIGKPLAGMYKIAHWCRPNK
jgi:hypothetical protein